MFTLSGLFRPILGLFSGVRAIRALFLFFEKVSNLCAQEKDPILSLARIFYQNVNVLFAAVFPEPPLADLDLRCVGFALLV